MDNCLKTHTKKSVSYYMKCWNPGGRPWRHSSFLLSVNKSVSWLA